MTSRICGTFPDPSTQVVTNFNDILYVIHLGAAVCGGIPIIHSLQADYLEDNITRVMGIMNGTTIFMVTKMEDEGPT